MNYLNNYFDRKRNIDGILFLDKPSGLSSNALLKKVKRLFMASKAGYIGTLDPIATGMLPICFGEATKFSQYLENKNKRYKVIARLGARTDTADVDGKIICIRSVQLNNKDLEQSLKYFKGNIIQIPSMFSALKYRGKPLYSYARKGISIPREMKAREIFIYELKLIHWDLTKIELEIYCSKGTYIRTLIDDIGEKLGCGAHVIQLRRLEIGNFSEKNMITFSSLQKIVDTSTSFKNVKKIFFDLDSKLLPIEHAVFDMPTVNISSSLVLLLRLGKTISVMNAPQSGKVCITEGNKKNFVGIGIINIPGNLSPYRLISHREKNKFSCENQG